MVSSTGGESGGDLAEQDSGESGGDWPYTLNPKPWSFSKLIPS